MDQQVTPPQDCQRSPSPGRRDRFYLFLVVLVLLALGLTRFVGLGRQAFHHDESIHCHSTWLLAHSGPQMYAYDPVYHGPFLYHFGAMFMQFVPDTDAWARAPYALMGFALCAMFFLLHRLLGRGAVLLIVAMLVLSPSLNYFSRFARNDVYQTAWLVGMLVSVVLYLRNPRPRLITAVVLFLTLSYCTKENSYVHNFALCFFLVTWGGWRILWYRRAAAQEIFGRYMHLTRLLILFGCMSGFVFFYVAVDCRVGPEKGLIGGLRAISTHIIAIEDKISDKDLMEKEGGTGYFSAPGQSRPRTLYLEVAVLGTLFLALFAEGVSLRLEQRLSSWRFLFALLLSGVFYTVLFLSLIGLAVWTQRQESTVAVVLLLRQAILLFLYAAAAACVLVIPDFVYRRFLSRRDTKRLRFDYSGLVAEWKHRVIGLWSLAFQVGLAAFVFLLLFSSLGTNPADGPMAGVYDYIGYWFRHQTGEFRIWAPWWYYLPRLFLLELFPIALIVIIGGLWSVGLLCRVRTTGDNYDGPHRFFHPVPVPLLCFAAYLAVFMIGIYAVLNEKVPWLITYQAFSLYLLAALMASHHVAMRGNPFCLCGVGIARKAVSIFWLILLLSGVFYTVFQHRLQVFTRSDSIDEVLVYTSTTPEFKQHVDRILAKSKAARKAGRQFHISIEGEADWPCQWYFRNETVTWGSPDLSGDVAICDDNMENNRRLQYPGEKAWKTDPVILRGWWLWVGAPAGLPSTQNLLVNLLALAKNSPNDCRNYFDEDPGEGYVTGFRDQIFRYIFHRKIWYPTSGEKVLVSYKTDRQIALDKRQSFLKGSEKKPVPVEPDRQFGVKGKRPGEMQEPRGMAWTPDGNLAVVDSHNGRIQVFSTEGALLQSFGKGRFSTDYSGPCGVACDEEGNFFVTDTWHHAVWKFSSSGEALSSTTLAVEDDYSVGMFGPRGIAVGRKGRLYVTDTGGCAVRVFDRDLTPLFSWGAKGGGPGMFDEPVGIAVNEMGRIYVADAGNGRIQVFDSQGIFIEQFDIWPSGATLSVAMEPNLAAMPGGFVVMSASMMGSVWVIDPRPGRHEALIISVASDTFSAPLGVAVDGESRIWLTGRGSSTLARVNIFGE